MSRSKKAKQTHSSVNDEIIVYLRSPELLEEFNRLSSLEILTGRFVKFDDFILWNFSSYFENVGLLELFSAENKKPSYPFLVQLFYTNIERVGTIGGSEKIKTLVKGMEIELTTKTIGKIFNIPYQGVSLSSVRMNDSDLLSNHIFLPGHGKPLNNSNKLRPFPRFIARILAYNLFPKTGSFHFISLELAKAIYAIMGNIQVNWAEVYFDNFLTIPRGFLPYGAFLTKIFDKFHVDLKSEKSVVRSIEFFDSNALTRMKLTNFEIQDHNPQNEPVQNEPELQQEDIPQTSTQAGASSSQPPPFPTEPSCFSDVQYNTLSARILELETGQRAIYAQNRYIISNQEDLIKKFEDLDSKLNSYFQGQQPPPAP